MPWSSDAPLNHQRNIKYLYAKVTLQGISIVDQITMNVTMVTDNKLQTPQLHL